MNAPLATVIAGDWTGRAKNPVRTPFEELFDGVDDLIKRVAETESADIRRVRAKVYSALVAAKSEFETGARQVHRQAVQVADSTDDRLRDNSGPALGVALLLGIGLGLIVSRRQ